MSLKKLNNFFRTLAFRLTIWYAVIFVLSTCVVFLFFYLLITSVVRDRTDQELIESARSLSSILNTRGIEAAQQQAFLEAQAAGERKIFLRFLSPAGQVFSSSNMSYWRDIGVERKAIQQVLEEKRPVFDTIRILDRKYPVRILYARVGPNYIMQTGQSMENHSRIIEAFRKTFILAMAALVVLAAVIGWFMARRALAGVEAVTETARRISDGSLDERVPVNKRDDEIDQLALTFNQMLDRIQTLVNGIKEMSDNIAHDLKSLITRIRGTAEITLTTKSSTDDYENMAASIIEDSDRLLEMINTMLLISRTEAGVAKPESDVFNIAAVVRDACELFQPLADNNDLTLNCDTPDTCALYGDVRLIQRMIANLLDNAIKYTPANGKVDLILRSDDRKNVVLSIRDTGIGLPPEELPHIFDRFYRCDPSRSESGVGLGLSFARAMATAHGGDIRVESEPGAGSNFTVTLPKLPDV